PTAFFLPAMYTESVFILGIAGTLLALQDVAAHFIRRYFSRIRCQRVAVRASNGWHTARMD
ncbi:MAG: hypothetical protein ACYCOU_23995, partial [Sulfobacillus sp.]